MGPILGIHNAPTYRTVMHAIIAEANAKGIPTYPVSKLRNVTAFDLRKVTDLTEKCHCSASGV